MKPRLRIPRQIRTGALAASSPGARLRCAVLASTGREWVAADLASGALLRNRAGGPVASPAAHRPLQVADVVVGATTEAPDPARPEAVELAEAGPALGTLSRRRARRLLRRLAAPERAGVPLLGRWGPSVALEELDGTVPSVVLVGLAAGAVELAVGPDGEVACWLRWSGVRQSLPLADPAAVAALTDSGGRLRARAVEEVLGFSPGYAVVALAEVRAGYVPKVVLSLLPA